MELVKKNNYDLLRYEPQMIDDLKRYFDGKLYALPLCLFRREAGTESVAGANERVSSIVGDMEAIAAKNKDVNTLLLEVDGRFKKRI